MIVTQVTHQHPAGAGPGQRLAHGTPARSALVRNRPWAHGCATASTTCPPRGVIAREIVEDLQAALAQFRLIADDLGDVVEQ